MTPVRKYKWTLGWITFCVTAELAVILAQAFKWL